MEKHAVIFSGRTPIWRRDEMEVLFSNSCQCSDIKIFQRKLRPINQSRGFFFFFFFFFFSLFFFLEVFFFFFFSFFFPLLFPFFFRPLTTPPTHANLPYLCNKKTNHRSQ